MADSQGVLLWDQFVTVRLGAGPAQEQFSRYGDKPVLFAGHREIAHLEAPGVIDLRITRAGWSRVSANCRAARSPFPAPAGTVTVVFWRLIGNVRLWLGGNQQEAP